MKLKTLLYISLLIPLIFISCNNSIEENNDSPEFYTVPLKNDSPHITLDEKLDDSILVMTYIAADSNLTKEDYESVIDMAKGYNTLCSNNERGQTPEISIIVLWNHNEVKKDFNYKIEKSKLFKIKQSFPDSDDYFSDISNFTEDLTESEDIWFSKDENINTADSKTLENFISFSRKHYKAEHEILIIKGHGEGIATEPVYKKTRAMCSDSTTSKDKTGINDILWTEEFSKALINNGYGSENQFDMMIFDVCYGANIEEAYEYKDFAKSLIASTHELDVRNLEYDKILGFLKNNVSIKDFGQYIISLYANKANEKQNRASIYKEEFSSLSFIDFSYIESTVKALKELAEALLENKDFLSMNKTKDIFNDENERIETTFKYTNDLGIFAGQIETLAKETKNEKIKDAAFKLNNRLNDAVLCSWKATVTKPKYAGISICMNAHNIGLSEYYFQPYTKDDFKFANETKWKQILQFFFPNDF